VIKRYVLRPLLGSNLIFFLVSGGVADAQPPANICDPFWGRSIGILEGIRVRRQFPRYSVEMLSIAQFQKQELRPTHLRQLLMRESQETRAV